MVRSEGGRGGCHGGGERNRRGEKEKQEKIGGEGGRRIWWWEEEREGEEREATLSWQLDPIHVINTLEKSHLNMHFASNCKHAFTLPLKSKFS